MPLGVWASPSLAVIVCAYTLDRYALLERALRSVRDQVPAPDQVIVIVDHNPELLARVSAAFPDLTVVPNDGPPGLSGARNTGLRAVTAEIVAFLDDDAAAEPGWLAALAAPYVDAHVAAVGGWAEPEWDAGRPAWFPEEFAWVVGCSYRGLPIGDADVRNMLGCNMSFRRAALLGIGGFDARLGRVRDHPVGAEETELCIRLRQAAPGSRIVHRPAARVVHHVPASRGRWAYFRARCQAEGWSKALLSRIVGAGDGLASERRHVLVTLPLGVLRGLGDAIRGDRGGLGRSGAIIAGTAATLLGYLEGLRAGLPPAEDASPATVPPPSTATVADREPAA
jgi:GT2 family glycosyltransferase